MALLKRSKIFKFNPPDQVSNTVPSALMKTVVGMPRTSYLRTTLASLVYPAGWVMPNS